MSYAAVSAAREKGHKRIVTLAGREVEYSAGTASEDGRRGSYVVADPAWKDFEKLVAWIEATAAPDTVVRHHTTLPDRHTGDPREIDVVVELGSGRHRTVTIGEVRDRSRPADVQWVEQAEQKRISVGAQNAFLVSRKGFSKGAVKKALALGITPLTFEEATGDRWDHLLVPMTLTLHGPNIRFGKGEVTFQPIDVATGRTFDILGSEERKWMRELAAVEDRSVGGWATSGTFLGVLDAALVDAAFRARERGQVDRERNQLVVTVQHRLPERVQIREQGSRQRREVAEVIGTVRFELGPNEFPLAFIRYRQVDGDTYAVLLQAAIEWMTMPFLVRFVLPDESGRVTDLRKVSCTLVPLDERGQRVFGETRLGFRVLREWKDEAGTPHLGVELVGIAQTG